MIASEAAPASGDTPTRASAPGAPSPAAPGTVGDPHITIRGLSKKFGSAVIYDDFDLDIPRGRFVSVFGPNGCGKSTLINLIAGLIEPDAGTIRFDGKRLRDTNFGYVFQ
ncbi:MAG: ATP-binding cassette domain-containing protein, partial [Alphaproteobacteria bacterium]|nr:ATP-binding cassette domain-containing protein [Alphaproteobacteria bacterium]